MNYTVRRVLERMRILQPRVAYSLTFSGAMINLFDPDPALISVVDVAHSLARVCRWNGHTRDHVSVAQHVAEAAALVERWTDGDRPDIAYAALHHDDDEYLLPDVNGQLKPFLPELLELSAIHQRACQIAFGIPIGLHEHPMIHDADRFCLAIEARDEMGDLWRPSGVHTLGAERYRPWPFELARDRFLEYHETLRRRYERWSA